MIEVGSYFQNAGHVLAVGLLVIFGLIVVLQVYKTFSK